MKQCKFQNGFIDTISTCRRLGLKLLAIISERCLPSVPKYHTCIHCINSLSPTSENHTVSVKKSLCFCSKSMGSPTLQRPAPCRFSLQGVCSLILPGSRGLPGPSSSDCRRNCVLEVWCARRKLEWNNTVCDVPGWRTVCLSILLYLLLHLLLHVHLMLPAQHPSTLLTAHGAICSSIMPAQHPLYIGIAEDGKMYPMTLKSQTVLRQCLEKTIAQ